MNPVKSLPNQLFQNTSTLVERRSVGGCCAVLYNTFRPDRVANGDYQEGQGYGFQSTTCSPDGW